jgi:hypothetical protein
VVAQGVGVVGCKLLVLLETFRICKCDKTFVGIMKMHVAENVPMHALV